MNGYITRGKKTVYFDSDGNRFSKKEQDWLRKHTEFLAMHYTGSLGMKKSQNQVIGQRGYIGANHARSIGQTGSSSLLVKIGYAAIIA